VTPGPGDSRPGSASIPSDRGRIRGCGCLPPVVVGDVPAGGYVDNTDVLVGPTPDGRGAIVNPTRLALFAGEPLAVGPPLGRRDVGSDPTSRSPPLTALSRSVSGHANDLPWPMRRARPLTPPLTSSSHTLASAMRARRCPS
jgi:hypothetical protein